MSEWVLAAALFLQMAVQIGTPLLLGTLGGILNEKVGHINLGIEGTMLLGASCGFLVAYYTQNPLISIIAAGLAGATGALVYAVVTVTFQANQTVTGFAVTVLGTGIANFVGKHLAGFTLSESFMKAVGPKAVPILSNIPLIGPALFQQSVYVYLSIGIAVLLFFYINKTRFGLAMRMVGENPGAADASGINTTLYKYVHIIAGGCLMGLGGAYLSMVYVSRWQDNMTAGLGWIAVALVIFSTWHPLKAIFGAYLFGALRGISYKMQNVNPSFFGFTINISSQLLDMLPYLMTIIVLIVITLRKKRENQAPAGLGLPYYREER